MIYSVKDISKYIIYYSNKKNYGITNTRLQIILYFIQVYFLKIKKVQCFIDNIEAWDIGPVVPYVYKKYIKFGDGQITDYKEPTNCFLNDNLNIDRYIIYRVIDLLAKYQTFDLLDMIHNQSSWLESYKSDIHNIISIKSIERFIDLQDKYT